MYIYFDKIKKGDFGYYEEVIFSYYSVYKEFQMAM